MKDNQTENKVVTLHRLGWSIRRIARELHISRERVHRIVASNSDKRDTTQEGQIKQKTDRVSKLDPYKSYIGDLLEKYPNITGQRVFEHLQEKGFDGGITIVRDYVKSIREVGSKTPVRMVETLPGQRASHVAHLVVNQESCVQWKGYLYVVPQKYIYELCPVRITEKELIVYSSDGKQLVVHPLAKSGQKGRYVGVHQKRGKKPDLPISDVISRLESFAPEMARYIEQLKQHKPHSWGSHLRRLLALKINYHTQDIMLAVNRAQDYNVYEAGDIEGFLKNNSESRYSTRLSIKPRSNDHYNEY
ncbi:MAG: helix-turn-helix domain-containing protein [Bacteroidales bacterium]|nr:helix-turn-helix domain-containing protein [Bacteroidales bacterium]